MASEQAHRIINTRERGTSTDINRITQLSDRNSILAAWYLSANDTQESGVFTGLEVTVAGGTATVSKGLALLDDGVASYPDSDYRWIELAATATSIALNTATANRWITVEIAPNANATITVPVDVFDPTTGAFVSTSLDKEVQSVPTITTVVSGVDFEFAAPTAGTLPLAYIFVDGGNSVGTQLANVVMCRPLLHSKAPLAVAESVYTAVAERGNKAIVQGGGVSVTTDGQVVQLEATMGRFYEARHPFWLQRLSTVDLTSTRAWDAATKASSETNVYLYAVPPPYPTGYGTIAKQEFVVGATAALEFESFNTLGNTDQVNCIVIASATPPTITGPQGAAVGNTTIHDTPFLQSAAAPASTREEWVYLGAVDWGTTEAKAQTFIVGSSRVRPDSRWPSTNVSSIGAAATPHAFNLKVGDGLEVDGDGLFPSHVSEIRTNIRGNATVAEEYVMELVDDEVGAVPGTLNARFSKDMAFTSDAATTIRSPMDLVQAGSSVTGEYRANSTLKVISLSYIDSIVASR